MEYDRILDYCSSHSTAASEELVELERNTHLKALSPQMISGHVQGRFLSFISKMIQPSMILEIGGFTGYATLCLSEGLAKDGRIVTIEGNIEIEELLKQNITKSKYANQIEVHMGLALDIIPTLTSLFDLIFIDASKLEYEQYYNLIFDKLRKGGYIIVDNVLWYNKVLDPQDDKKALALDNFNKIITNDTRIENVLLPFRDGLQLIRKISD